MTEADSIVALGGIFFVAGLYMAVQEALDSTVTAEIVPADRRGTGYGVLETVNGGTKFVSSAGVGALWTAVSPVLAFGLAVLFMLLGTLALLRAQVG